MRGARRLLVVTALIAIGLANVPVVAAADVTVAGSNVNIANQATVPVSGTADPNVPVDLSVTDFGAAHTVSDTTTSDGSGNWTMSEDLSSLNDGAISFDVTCTTCAGATTASDTSKTKDTVAPAVAITAYPHPINLANENPASVSGTGENLDTIHLTVTDTSSHTVSGNTTVSGTSWTVSGLNLSSLIDGDVITYTVTATDGFGNTGTDSQTATKGTVVPTVAITAWTHPINIANEGSASASGTGQNGDTIHLAVTDTSSHSVSGNTSVSGGASR